jgi:hypothetical protein
VLRDAVTRRNALREEQINPFLKDIVVRTSNRRLAFLVVGAALIIIPGATHLRAEKASRIVANGKLDKRHEKLSLDEFRAIARQLEFETDPGAIGNATSRECAGSADHALCPLRITPVKGVVAIAHEDVTENGWILAKIENYGSLTEKTLGIEANRTVFWVARERTSFPWYGYESFLVDTIDHKVARKRSWKRCPQHDDDPNTTTVARFQKCPKPSVGSGQLEVLMEHTSPPWITCAQGCCYAS